MLLIEHRLCKAVYGEICTQSVAMSAYNTEFIVNLPAEKKGR